MDNSKCHAQKEVRHNQGHTQLPRSPDTGLSNQPTALLTEALRDFPSAVLLHRLRFDRMPLAAPDREHALLEWILAEYSGPSRGADGLPGGIRTTTTLRNRVFTLQKMRGATPAAR